MFSAAVITISDTGARGQREDLSGPAIKELLVHLPAEVTFYEVIPDDKNLIAEKIAYCSDILGLDLIVTTGGTGVGLRDVTPEATRAVIEKEIPGMAEVMRLEGLKKTPHAMISRAVVGIRGRSLIVTCREVPVRQLRISLPFFPPFPTPLPRSKGMTRNVHSPSTSPCMPAAMRLFKCSGLSVPPQCIALRIPQLNKNRFPLFCIL